MPSPISGDHPHFRPMKSLPTRVLPSTYQSLSPFSLHGDGSPRPSAYPIGDLLSGLIRNGKHQPSYVVFPERARPSAWTNQRRRPPSDIVPVYPPPNFGPWIEMLVSPGSTYS